MDKIDRKSDRVCNKDGWVICGKGKEKGKEKRKERKGKEKRKKGRERGKGDKIFFT